MPQLRWDQTDFMECLEVVPDIDDYETRYVYRVARNGLELEVLVRPLESIIEIALFQGGCTTPTMSFNLFVQGEASYLRDKQGERLHFSRCLIGGAWRGRLIRMAESDAIGLNIELSIKPHIRIRILD